LIDPQQVKDVVARESADADAVASLKPGEDMTQYVEWGMEAGFQLQAEGSNVWVSTPEKLTHYDWETGKVLQELPVADGFGEMVLRGGELLKMGESETGQQLITHINLATGEVSAEEIDPSGKHPVAVAHIAPGTMVVASAGGADGSSGAGLPLMPGASAGKPLDPGKVAEQAQSLPLPARIALPALLANSMHQERIMQEANDESDDSRPQRQGAPGSRQAASLEHAERYSLVPSGNGFVQFSARLLESRIVSREAMKAPPTKSVLDSGNLNVTKTMDVANEILNEMQRTRGGSTVQEDESRYQVSIRRPESVETADWTGEVVGPPALFPLKTVNVLTAGKTVTVFDKTNKKLWQATLAYALMKGAGGFGAGLFGGGAFGGGSTQYGEGPCVERGNTLYIFDQAVLTAFDLSTGNARWRLPSVGILGLFFDDKGMMYVNSTTASPENIKFAKQIDVNDKTEAILLKIDPKTGKTLWKVKPGGFISYLSGEYIYAYYVHYASEDEEAAASLTGMAPNPPFVHIRRLNPRNGDVMWDYYQARAPLDIQFNGNMMEVVFKKEVQVLKFLSL